MGPEETKYKAWLADNPDVKQFSVDINPIGMAKHFNCGLIDNFTGKLISFEEAEKRHGYFTSIDWTNSRVTVFDQLEYYYSVYNLAIEAMKTSKPFEFNDRHNKIPLDLSRETIDTSLSASERALKVLLVS